MKDPHEQWQTLQTMYAGASEERRQLLRRKLSELVLREGQSIEDHLLHINELTYSLANCGVAVNNIELVHLVLLSLPPSWDLLCSAYKVLIQKDPPTFASLQTFLVDEEMSWNVKASRSGIATEANLAASNCSFNHNRNYCKGKDRYNNNKHLSPAPHSESLPEPRAGAKTGSCNICGNPGHWANKCPRQAQLEQQIQSLQQDLAKLNQNRGPDRQAHAASFEEIHVENAPQQKISFEAHSAVLEDFISDSDNDTSGDAVQVIDSYLSEVKRAGS
jgi:hypothetical protein